MGLLPSEFNQGEFQERSPACLFCPACGLLVITILLAMSSGIASEIQVTNQVVENKKFRECA